MKQNFAKSIKEEEILVYVNKRLHRLVKEASCSTRLEQMPKLENKGCKRDHFSIKHAKKEEEVSDKLRSVSFGKLVLLSRR